MTKIFVAGHRGMVGSAICRQLELTDFEVITANRDELDLTNQAQVAAFFGKNKFDQVYLAAAKVGGIHSNNTYPAAHYVRPLLEADAVRQGRRCALHLCGIVRQFAARLRGVRVIRAVRP